MLRLFEGAAEAGVRVEQRHLELEAVLRHVEAAGAAVVLTDGGRLRCLRCSVNRLRRLLPWTPSFAGHYVLLIGSHPRNKLVYYRNPAFADSNSFFLNFLLNLLFSLHLMLNSSIFKISLTVFLAIRKKNMHFHNFFLNKRRS